jgi:dTMP kinase
VWTGWSIARVLRRREDGEGGEELAGLAEQATDDGGGPVTAEGLFVVFEGGEGAGKSTQVRLLRAAVERLGREVVVTREPGGTPTGEAVREVLLDADGAVTPRAEALLYAAARAEHAAEVLAPALERGDVVLCDRYVDSSIVYQGVGRDLGDDVVADLNQWATDGLQADLTILLDVPADVGLARARDVEHPDRLEAAGLEFHERVNEAFRQRARRAPARYLVLDATEPVEWLQQQIRARVTELLGQDLDDGPDASDEAPDPAADDVGPAAGEVGAPPAPAVRANGGRREEQAEPLFEDVPAVPAPSPLEPRVTPSSRPEERGNVPAWLALPGEEDEATEGEPS